MPIQSPTDRFEHVVTFAAEIFGDHDKAVEWLHQPLASLRDKTPMQVLCEGRTDDVVRYLETIQLGFLG